jgi:hypothetical protein
VLQVTRPRIVRVVCISMKDASESGLAAIAQQFAGEELADEPEAVPAAPING